MCVFVGGFDILDGEKSDFLLRKNGVRFQRHGAVERGGLRAGCLVGSKAS